MFFEELEFDTRILKYSGLTVTQAYGKNVVARMGRIKT